MEIQTDDYRLTVRDGSPLRIHFSVDRDVLGAFDVIEDTHYEGFYQIRLYMGSNCWTLIGMDKELSGRFLEQLHAWKGHVKQNFNLTYTQFEKR